MKRWINGLAAVAAALVLLSPSAEARSRKAQPQGEDPRVAAAGFAVGAASTVGYFALTDWRLNSHSAAYGLGTTGAFVVTTVGCAAAAPMLATVMARRPLTMREGHVLFAGCVIPILGPMLMNAAYDAHPEWEGKKPRARR
jgi:hypothetical protein